MSYFKKFLAIAPLSHAIWRTQEAAVLDEMKLETPILDIGCGFGEFFSVFYDDVLDIGIDNCASDLEQIVEGRHYKKVLLSDARELPFRNSSYSSVVSISTVEHILNVEKVFDEAFRVMKKGGSLVITVPTKSINSKLFVPRVLRLVYLDFLADLYTKLFHSIFKHENLFTTKQWLQKIKKAGFKDISYKGTINTAQLTIFEIFLIFALPTQIFRKLLTKRLPFSPQIRIMLLDKLFSPFLKPNVDEDINIVITATK